ncbi:MAG: substrate-binding domain-containing protein [Flexilinea sp.]
MKKNIFFVVIVFVLMLVFTLSTYAAPDGLQAAGEKFKIGVSFYALSGEYNTNLKNALEAYYQAEGLADTVELTILDASSDANTQNSQVENLLASGVDAIILIAGDADAQAIVVEEAYNEGIPVIELCTKTSAEDYRTTFVGSDDIVAGRMLMEFLGDLVDGKGKMIILHGPTGISAEINRHTGAKQIIEEKKWDIEIVSEKVCNWSRDEAMSAMENIITSNLDFNIIFAENDEMAVGALYALEGSGLKYVIGGIDAIPDAVQAVADGKMNCTFFQDAVTQAETALRVAIEAANGQKIEKSYDIDFVLVTAENAADFQ